MIKKLSLKPSHKQVNDGLSVVAVLLGVYIAVAPFLPNLSLWYKGAFQGGSGYTYQGELASLDGEDVSSEQLPPPEENTLLIPEIFLDQKILEGQTIDVIASGDVWRRPNTSTPDAGGNTVIVGHRWSYNNDGTFYHLDKLEVGDKFSVYWNKQEYVYEVFETKVVPPTEVSIEGTSEESVLTLYTCTPLWTATNRLVVISKLISSPEQSI